jgi:hypothetical protein
MTSREVTTGQMRAAARCKETYVPLLQHASTRTRVQWRLCQPHPLLPRPAPLKLLHHLNCCTFALQMPFRDRGQPLMRPLQRDMAIDPNRGRMVEPTRYLQRPMLPPPHHFDQRYSDGYAHGYPRDGPDLESSQHYGGADKWRWDARGPPIDPVEDERGRREGWSGPYGSHRAGRSSGASARIHRELQRDMPPTSSRLYTAGGFYGGRAGPSEEGLAMRTAPLRPANRRYTHPAYDSEGDKHPHGIPSAGATQFPSAGYGDNAGSDLYSNSQSSSGVTNSSSSDALRHQKPQ